MPTPPKATENMTKHLGSAARSAREEAQKKLERKFVRLTAPAIVTSDSVAKKYWRDIVIRMKEITLLDNVDIDMLAVYCLGLSRLDQLRLDAVEAKGKSERVLKRTLDKFLAGEYSDEDYPTKVIRACLSNEADIIKLMQAQERVVLAYAEKLGLTPAGRVRLAKKRAEEKPVTEEGDMYDD